MRSISLAVSRVALAPDAALYRGALARMPVPQNRDPRPPPIAG